jgi:O-glycosyl hydrolase
MRIIHSAILKSISAMVIANVLLATHPSSYAQTASINAGTVHQTMDGFGAQDWQFADNLTSAQADLFFSRTAGIGLEYVRTANTWDGGIPDLTTLQAAVARGALVELSIQSPPCGGNGTSNLKWSSAQNGESCTQSGDAEDQPAAFSDGSASANGTCFRSDQSLATSFATYAKYLVSYIQTMQGAPNNIPIAVLDVQNEPNITSSHLGACLWGNGSNFDNFIANYLGPAMHAAGLTTKIMMASGGNWFITDQSTTCLEDSSCAQYVSDVSGHGYNTTTPQYPFTPTAYSLGTSGGRHLWMSETSDSSSWDTSMTSGLTMAKNIHAFLTVANVSAYEWWQLAVDPSQNFGLTDSSFNPTKRFYVMGNWSKFVRPGWVMISATATPQSGVFLTAFENQATGAFVIVAVNANANPVSQTFSLVGLTTTSVTPYITDPNNNLTPQSSISVSGNGFTSTLTASSVTSFSGSVSTLSAPTNLSGTLIVK